MTEAATPTPGMNPTRTSARLAEKLKKLMQSMETNGYKDDMMEMDEEEQRKQTCAVQSPVNLMKVAPNSLSAAPSPEVKKSRNDETPTAHTKAKALFHTPSTGTQNKLTSNTTAMPEPSKTMGTLQLAKAPQTGMFDC